MTERIDCAAIRWRGETFYVPQPGRHHDVIAAMTALGHGQEAMFDQGFTTTSGRFVDRKEAMKIARAAGQLIPDLAPDGVTIRRQFTDKLFSEDIF